MNHEYQINHRLLFMTDCFAPPLEGGSVVYLYNIVSNLPPADTLVLTTAREGDNKFDKVQAYQVFRTPRLWKDFTKWERAREIIELASRARSIVREQRVDLVHAGETYPSGLAAWWLKKRLGLPYVVYLYAEEINGVSGREDLFGRVLKRIYRVILRQASGCVVVSDYTRDLLIENGFHPARVMKVIPMVGDHKMADEAGRLQLLAQLGHTGVERYVLSVGRLIERKGFDNLLRAFSIIQETFPEVRLLIVGRGPDAERLNALADKLGLAGRVHFAGFVPDNEMPAYYDVCDIFAMPHRETPDGDTEGCPTVFLEANAHGKPAIGGSAGGVRDAIIDGETGLIVDGTKPTEIAGALKRLLADPVFARRLGENGCRRVKTELSPLQGAQKIMEFSREILASEESAG